MNLWKMTGTFYKSVMIDSSIDIGIKTIVYVKHWLRSLSLLFLVVLFTCIFCY